MISDHTIGSKVQNLVEYYKVLYDLQKTAHSPEYMLVHDEIKSLLKNCSSYTELGVNQGTTLALALLENIPKIRAYDISLKAYNPASKHFEEYAKEKNLNFSIFEANTHKCTIESTDLLYIDTKHTYEHLQGELKLHSNKAQKYIVCHDTTLSKGLKKAVLEFVKIQPKWKIKTDCTINVGFMTLERR